MKTQCENCSHNNVCSHKKHYEELVQTLKDMSRLIENGPFNITVTCRFYSNEKI
ncbi:MAG: hypothetical protein K2N06_05390 [Oscillospiraceae bacterium]|nr:hypothetical protein [Oscillospiraceae bacterium]